MPSVPPAPPLFSTVIGWPSSLESASNTVRGMTSVALPAPNGMKARMGCEGQVWAQLLPDNAVDDNATVSATSTIRQVIFITSPLLFPPAAAGLLLFAGILHASRAAIGARIMAALQRAVRMQDDRTGMPHSIGIGVGEHLDIVAGRHQPVDEIAVEPGFHAQVCVRRTPGAP